MAVHTLCVHCCVLNYFAWLVFETIGACVGGFVLTPGVGPRKENI
jgi:hypothetical protein